MPRCAAIVGYKSRYQVEWRQQCQQQASHIVEGVVLCGTHFNAGFRRPLDVVTTLRQLNEGDL